MEHFIVSARKYRPSSFEEVVGQRAITSTLENAIANDHLAQALLFTGPRGVGKTSCARILAKRINQDGSEAEDEDFGFNIFELDAASNNSVDDIRNLTDQVRIPPQVGKYKVYIIDEVHMLSSSAFNAFLKTLEEPPRHAIFILATTEKHKIIPTILSRCQIFDFKRITIQDIKEQLSRVAGAEGIEAEDDALHIIAQKADGAMRDALSIFDRVVSFSGKKLTREAVAQNLNVLDYSYYFTVTDLILANDLPELLLFFNDILSKGFDAHHFIRGLASHFRDLLVCKNAGTVQLLEVGQDVRKMYEQQALKADSQFLIRGIERANDCDLDYKKSQNQRLLVELCLMQLGSLTFDEQKKKSKQSVRVIPPSYFRQENGRDGSKPDVAPPKVEKYEKAETRPSVSAEQKTPPPPKPAIEPEQPEVTKVNKEMASESGSQPDLPVSDPQKIARRNASKVSALSIKSIKRKQELIQQQAGAQRSAGQLPEDPFTEEQMKQAWSEYTQKLNNKGKYNLHSHLTMGEPVLENNLIHLIFPNETIKVEVERAKGQLLNFLKERLNNHAIDLSIEVNEEETKKYAYTTREKFELLKEKNPLIDKLRSEFELDL
jgi:DNA polymerase-3 subunit gamma/tau